MKNKDSKKVKIDIRVLMLAIVFSCFSVSGFVTSIKIDDEIVLFLSSLFIQVFSFLGFGCAFKIAFDMFDINKKQW